MDQKRGKCWLSNSSRDSLSTCETENQCLWSGTQEYSFVLEAGSRLSLHKPIRRSLAGEVPLDGYAVASAQLELPLLRGRCPGRLLDDPTRRHRRSMSSGKVARQGSPTDCSRLCADKTFRMAQQGVNPGVNINSNRCLYTIPEKKVDKLVREVAEVCGIALTSPLQCSKVRGEAQQLLLLHSAESAICCTIKATS